MFEDAKGGTAKSEEAIFEQEPAHVGESVSAAVADWLRTAADPALRGFGLGAPQACRLACGSP